jgi:transcriptional regulator with XRE-family HTH domain
VWSVRYDGPSNSSEAVFGARVKALREEIGIPLASLAATVGDVTGTAMTAAELALLEHGERPLRLNEAVALVAVVDMTVEEMLRPMPAVDEQLRRAQEALGLAQVRMAEARAEYNFAQTQLHRLRNGPISASNGPGGGQRAATHPTTLDPTTHASTTRDSGGSDGLHLAQREGNAAAG